VKEVVLRFPARPGSCCLGPLTWYGQHSQSTVTITDAENLGLQIVGVSLNGAPLKLRAIGPLSVSVTPGIPLEWGRVAIHCLAPDSPDKPPQPRQGTYPAPPVVYGLQRPESRTERVSA